MITSHDSFNFPTNVRTQKQVWQHAGGLRPFCKRNVGPDPVSKPVVTGTVSLSLSLSFSPSLFFF